jgi:hypothetical protein
MTVSPCRGGIGRIEIDNAEGAHVRVAWSSPVASFERIVASVDGGGRGEEMSGATAGDGAFAGTREPGPASA